MSYKVIGKIEVEDKYTKDPVNNGLTKQKYGLDLKIIGDDGELDSEAVIEAGFAHKARFGFRNKATGEEIFYEGHGVKEEDGEVVMFSGEHEGYAVPADGYLLEGPGISAIEHSNGLRMVNNFKQLPDGCYQAFGVIEGAGTASFPHGDTICVGAAKARGGKGHGNQK